MEDATRRTLKPSVLAKTMLRLLKSKSPLVGKTGNVNISNRKVFFHSPCVEFWNKNRLFQTIKKKRQECSH